MTEYGKAITKKKLFSRSTTISQIIKADESIIWNLLTNASDFPRWNSTIISIDGDIKKGQKIKLKNTLDPKRVFNLKIKDEIPLNKLVWGDAMGERTFSLKKERENTLFTMSEKIGGPIFPLFAFLIPSFDESFEQFTEDLKREAEA